MKTRLLLKLTGLSLKGKVVAGVVAASVVGTSAVGTYKYVEYRQEKQARIVAEVQVAKDNAKVNKDTASNSTVPTTDVVNAEEVKTDEVKAVDTPTTTDPTPKEEPKKEEPTATKPTSGGTAKPETPSVKPQEDTKPKVNAWVYDEALTNQWNSLDNDNTYTGVAYNKIYEALRAYAEGKISADSMRINPSPDDKYRYTSEPYVITRKYWTEPGIGVMIINHYTVSPTKITVAIGSVQSMHSAAKSAGLYILVSDYEKKMESEMIFRKVVCYKNEATNQVRVARLVASIWFTGDVMQFMVEPGYKFL